MKNLSKQLLEPFLGDMAREYFILVVRYKKSTEIG